VWDDPAAGIHRPAQTRGVGYVFQEITLFPHLTVWGNVAYAARNEGRVEELLRMFDIWHLKDSPPQKISGGERQRCCLCQVLAMEPRVLLMDEPFSALDLPQRRKLGTLIRAVKDQFHVPIVHVTHDFREALLLADEILPVVSGRVEPKWLLPFFLSRREGEGAVCRGREGEDERDEGNDVELPVVRQGYCL
ncbi:MAG: ATP-binding cassette domain-containing protein, partial [Syntrophales bacterium]|nr:ATP-binding cassette domain-containing protein [Syntrophales bacterium]